MKLIGTNHIEISYANAKALVQDFEQRLAEGKTAESTIYKRMDGETIVLSLVADEDHYTEGELETRRSPYLPPEAWAGI